MTTLIVLSVLTSMVMSGLMFSPLKDKLPFGWKATGISIAISLTFIFFSKVVIFADDKHNYEIIYPNGKLDVVTTSGPVLVWFADVKAWRKSISISSQGTDDTEGEIGVIGVRFSDKIGANVKVSARYRLPDDEVQFKIIVKEFRSIENLVTNVLVRDIQDNTKNTANNYQAFDYMSGGRTEFGQLFRDVVKNGSFMTRKVKRKASEEEVLVNGKRTIKRLAEQDYTERVLDKRGNPVRIQSIAGKYGIILKEAIPYNVIIDPKFVKRLEAQKNETAKRQLDQQKIETAKTTQERIIAQGESDKARERAIQEQAQIKELTRKETTLKKAKIERDLALIEKETAKIQGQTTVLLATADARASKMKVAAGLTPERRAYWRYRSDSIISANFSKAKGPNNVSIGGGSGKGGDLTSTLIQVEMAREMMKNRGIKK